MTYKQAEPTRTVHIHPLVRLPGLLLKCLTNTASQKKKKKKDLLHICNRILDIFNPGIKVIRTTL